MVSFFRVGKLFQRCGADLLLLFVGKTIVHFSDFGEFFFVLFGVFDRADGVDECDDVLGCSVDVYEGAVGNTVLVNDFADGDRSASAFFVGRADAVQSVLSLDRGHRCYGFRNGDVAAGAGHTRADGGGVFSAGRGHVSAADRDVAAGAFPAGADARSVASAGCSHGCVADGDVAALTVTAAADARSVVSAGCGDGAAADRDGAAGTFKAAADACSVVSAGCGHGTAADRDVAAGILIAGADAHLAGRGDGAAVDRDVAAGRTNGSADACRTGSARRVDDAAFDDDIAAAAVPVRADPCGVAVGTCGKSSFALDGQRFAFGHVNTRKVFKEALDAVLAFQNDGGVAETGNARPFVAIVIFAVDSYVFERDGRAVGDSNLVVVRKRAGDRLTVINYDVGSNLRKIDNGDRLPLCKVFFVACVRDGDLCHRFAL